MEHLPDLNALLVYAKVVEHRSFTKAAYLLKMQKSTVSRMISNLEVSLKRQLLYRTTRQVEPTREGKELLSLCGSSISKLILDLELSARRSEPMRGRIRIASVQDIGTALLSPIIMEFCQIHPLLEIDMYFGDDVVDLVANGIDISVRAGRVLQQSYRGRRVGTVKFILVASPIFLERLGVDLDWRILQSVDFLCYRPMLHKGHFMFVHGSQRMKFVPALKYQSSSTMSLLEMAIAGAGVAALPDFLCQDALKAGKLERILKEWATPDCPISVITPAKIDSKSTISIFSHFIASKLKAKLRGA
jgi:DNA-binding transcriptional LysR family regulator